MNLWRRFLDWFRPVPTRYPSQVGPVEPFDATSLAVRHNAERAKHALHLLLHDSRLDVDAMMRATHAAEVNLTALHLHDGFVIVDPRDVEEGENAAKGQADAGSVMAGWMKSPGHRANILDPRSSRVGFGRATSRESVTYWYAVFAG